ncbi:hypothetical protein FRB95_013935 [Tulasnella sp. JGI-2019a]|nr:hypothetical protein FRB95_013935 [Tulasnella sp. JGI-2019a]
MRSTILAITTLFSAALVSAESTTSSASGLKARGGSQSCASSHFFYSTKNCCLPKGGLSNTNCPSDRSCPNDWYYHPDHNGCVPKTSSSPQPSCGGTFSAWSNDEQCCKKPTPPPAPPAPPVTPTPSCPGGHFFYSDKGACLPNGGPGNNPPCPGDRGCPSDWWWHGSYNSCVPKNPNPPANPDCGTGNFRQWDNSEKCCKAPPPPPPTPSGSYHKPRGQTKRTKLARQVSACPQDLQECPIKGFTEVECVDGNEDLRNCGGCSTLGRGRDCGAIPNVVGVTCIAATKGCKVTSCDDGYVPSSDATSCVPSMLWQKAT